MDLDVCYSQSMSAKRKAKGTKYMEQIKNDIVDYLKANSFMDNNTQLER